MIHNVQCQRNLVQAVLSTSCMILDLIKINNKAEFGWGVYRGLYKVEFEFKDRCFKIICFYVSFKVNTGYFRTLPKCCDLVPTHVPWHPQCTQKCSECSQSPHTLVYCMVYNKQVRTMQTQTHV